MYYLSFNIEDKNKEEKYVIAIKYKKFSETSKPEALLYSYIIYKRGERSHKLL